MNSIDKMDSVIYRGGATSTSDGILLLIARVFWLKDIRTPECHHSHIFHCTRVKRSHWDNVNLWQAILDPKDLLFKVVEHFCCQIGRTLHRRCFDIKRLHFDPPGSDALGNLVLGDHPGKSVRRHNWGGGIGVPDVVRLSSHCVTNTDCFHVRAGLIMPWPGWPSQCQHENRLEASKVAKRNVTARGRVQNLKKKLHDYPNTETCFFCNF